MSDNRTIQEMANDSVAKFVADQQAAHRPTAPTPTQLLEQARFRELVTREALLHNVRPSAFRHVVRDAEAMFELKDDALVARNHAVDPHDPLAPLSPARWLQDLAKTDDYLFAEPGPAH